MSRIAQTTLGARLFMFDADETNLCIATERLRGEKFSVRGRALLLCIIMCLFPT